MLQAGKRLRKATGVMAGTGDRRKSPTLPILPPASRCQRMCCVIAGVSLARRPVAAACDAFCFFWGAGVLWMARSFACGFPGGWVWNRRGGRYRLAGLDVRNVKTQDLTPNTASHRRAPARSLGCSGSGKVDRVPVVRPGVPDQEPSRNRNAGIAPASCPARAP